MDTLTLYEITKEYKERNNRSNNKKNKGNKHRKNTCEDIIYNKINKGSIDGDKNKINTETHSGDVNSKHSDGDKNKACTESYLYSSDNENTDKNKNKGVKKALCNVSLELECGIYGLLGPNGAGKSTLMNIITGNIKPTSGSVLWNGRDIYALGENFRSIIGYAPQQQGLYNTFSGRRFLSYMAALKGIPKKEVRQEIERVLSYVNMQEAADRAIGTYSGGMKQRILIAQAILGSPKLVVLDEPTAGLDPKERVRVREQIKALSGDKIILVSTHVVSDIEPIAKEILLIRSGSIIDRDTVENLCQKHGGCNDLEEVYMSIFGEEENHVSVDSI